MNNRITTDVAVLVRVGQTSAELSCLKILPTDDDSTILSRVALAIARELEPDVNRAHLQLNEMGVPNG